MSNDLSNTGNISILLVENSKTARTVLLNLLTSSGYQVNAVATGKDALEFLENNSVDLMLLDVFMPLMNGYELAQIIRSSDKEYSTLPILAYSSSESPKDRNLCLEAGINDYLIKSENSKELISYLYKNKLHLTGKSP